MILILFTFALISAIFIIFISCRKYINPYRLYMVFGKKGSGKTTYMTKLAVQYHKKGRPVYSNTEIPYATVINVAELGQWTAPPESVILIDEVGMIWDNRNFKNFREDVRNYFKLQRHYRHTVYLFSQTFDIDLKLRTLTDAMYLVTSPIPILSIVRRIKRTIVLVQPAADAEGRIADSLQFVPWWMNIFGAKSLQFTFIPRWAKYFDSHAAPSLHIWPQDPCFTPDDVDVRWRILFLNFLKNLFTKFRFSGILSIVPNNKKKEGKKYGINTWRKRSKSTKTHE